MHATHGAGLLCLGLKVLIGDTACVPVPAQIVLRIEQLPLGRPGL